MSKCLEAWERIKKGIDTNVWECDYWDDIELIEKELKALNVFKELKFFDIRCDRENGKMIYLLVWNAVSICKISKEQYDLLKEVLL